MCMTIIIFDVIYVFFVLYAATAKLASPLHAFLPVSPLEQDSDASPH